MKTAGGILMTAGILTVLGFSLMDTSAGVTNPLTGQSMGRVNNLGLMDTRRNGLMVGVGMFLGGIVLMGFGSNRRSHQNSGGSHQNSGGSHQNSGAKVVDVTKRFPELWVDLPAAEWFDNGSVRTCAASGEGGDLDGAFIRYNQFGDMAQRGIMRRGNLHGPFTQYLAASGTVSESGFYDQGIKCGSWYDVKRGVVNHSGCGADVGDVTTGGEEEVAQDPPAQASDADALLGLASLLREGLITRDEFDDQKKKLLAPDASVEAPSTDEPESSVMNDLQALEELKKAGGVPEDEYRRRKQELIDSI
jgi:hypothetical protein